MERSLAQADSYARQRVNTAKGDVARFTALLAANRKAPSVTRRRFSLETMRDMLPVAQQVCVFASDEPDAWKGFSPPG